MYILNRTKDMIISGRANVYPREIDEVLVETPYRAGGVCGRVPDKVWGEAVTAIAVRFPGVDFSPEELITFEGERLADYKKPK